MLEKIFATMQLAGEAGSLLKIEEEIRSAVEVERAAHETRHFFAGRRLDPDEYWQHFEAKIYAALRDYAEQAENGGGFQRRLFAEDAARAFAFIDVCRKRYDVAVMNPPFGEPAATAKTHIEKGAGPAKADIYTAFLSSWCCQLNHGGRLGAISPASTAITSLARKLRRTSSTRHSRVNSSATHKNFSRRPSIVWSLTQS
ncbi:MAG TPA: hypothetical protein VI136_02275 [Verrucomicrobiae bacterium]